MLFTARHTVQERRGHRRGQPFGDTPVAACTAYLEASREVDEALQRREEVQCRRATTLEEDERVERAAGDAWEALFLAAIELDAVLPDPEHSAAELVRLMATLHNPTMRMDPVPRRRRQALPPRRPGTHHRGADLDWRGRARPVVQAGSGAAVTPGLISRSGLTGRSTESQLRAFLRALSRQALPAARCEEDGDPSFELVRWC
jgi:hypothetical protein